MTSSELPWDLEALPKATRDLETLKADMDAWGFCLVEQAFTADQVSAIPLSRAVQSHLLNS